MPVELMSTLHHVLLMYNILIDNNPVKICEGCISFLSRKAIYMKHVEYVKVQN
jgi:hypothetical protein